MSEIGTTTEPAPPTKGVPCSSCSSVSFSPTNIANRRVTDWGAIRADTVHITRRERFEYGYQAPCHLLIAAERSERDAGETLIEGLPKSSLRDLSRKLSFVPAGHRFHGWQAPRVLTRVTYFYIDPRGPQLDPELRFSEIPMRPRLFFFDHDLWETAQKLKSLSENPDSDSPQYAQALTVALLHELVRLEKTAPARATARGGLATWQQRRVAEFIEEHLGDDVSLSDLAQLVRLSPFHFARAFKQSFGVPPHRYHIGRRMERAKDLLAVKGLSVTEIGIDIGFRETSSFTAAFHKFTGHTPSDYRRHLD
ncbi:MAG: AraC family transcriptional regulator [Alphaproteobacteria bacterium]|nr:AraC family transcriptional regulator [Alphaproteobacteria bacterium]